MSLGFKIGLTLTATAVSTAVASSVLAFEPTDSLADVAERYTEHELASPPGSVHAVAIDRRIKLGDCPSSFTYRYPFGTKTTLEILCPDNPGGHRYVTMELPRDVRGNSSQMASLSPSPMNTGSIWVASHDLPYGKVLSTDDLVQAKSDGQKAQGMTNIADLLGNTLTRPLTTGAVVGRADMRPTQIVKRQMPVMAYSEFAGGQVTSKMVALQAGAVGEFIELENPQSGRKRYGQIQSDGTVRLGGPEIQKNLVAGAKVGP